MADSSPPFLFDKVAVVHPRADIAGKKPVAGDLQQPVPAGLGIAGIAHPGNGVREQRTLIFEKIVL